MWSGLYLVVDKSESWKVSEKKTRGYLKIVQRVDQL